MSRSNLWKGLVYGAVAGGVIALLDKDTRSYTMEQTRDAGRKCRSYVKHPSEAIHNLRMCYEGFSAQVNKGVEDLLELIQKAESMLNKVGELNREVKEQLEAVDKPEEAS